MNDDSHKTFLRAEPPDFTILRAEMPAEEPARPHFGRDDLPPMRAGPYPRDGVVFRDSRFGGLLKHYYRQAA